MKVEAIKAPLAGSAKWRLRAFALYNLRAAPLVQYDGAVDSGLRISVSPGRLAPATRGNLLALGVAVPDLKGAQWTGRDM
ncbi:MAG TPA: hypothetical protein VF079_07485 [Sphingomicrobium sp.]